eukprot:361458-Chlamydomonas_euryale.AAC.2
MGARSRCTRLAADPPCRSRQAQGGIRSASERPTCQHRDPQASRGANQQCMDGPASRGADQHRAL